MPKNIVILFDGTSNEISASRTNVLRLYGTLLKSAGQVVWYDPGVGTIGATNAWLRLTRTVTEFWGNLTGWGLDENVKEAYRFLVENYDNGVRPGTKEKLPHDSIYLFGFSRGAYSARVLAGFINAFGLIEPRNLNLIDYAYRAYKGIGEKNADRAKDREEEEVETEDDAETEEDAGKKDADKGKNGVKKDDGGAFAEMRLYERILRPRRPPIKFLGLFDSVSSLIEHGKFGPRLRSHAYTARNPSVEFVRHAVAIDERRTMFRPQLCPEGAEYWGGPFKPKNVAKIVPQNAREVWFSGVHSDVGGGYPEAESQLAKIPLKWMIEQSEPAGLHYKARTVNSIVLGLPAGDKPSKYVKPDPKAKKHNSMKWLWALLEFIPSRRHKFSRRWSIFGITIPLFERRPIPAGARVHRSALDRPGAVGGRSRNIPPDAEVEVED